MSPTASPSAATGAPPCKTWMRPSTCSSSAPAFGGLGAAYTFMKEAESSQSCLLLDNHAIFGGEAKQNEFEVDGTRLTAPQGSNGMVWPPGDRGKIRFVSPLLA